MPTYDVCVSRALALPPPPDFAPENVLTCWQKLQCRLSEYEESNILQHEVEGERVWRESINAAGQRVCVYLSAYLTAFAAAGLGPPSGTGRRLGHSFDFSTRPVRA